MSIYLNSVISRFKTYKAMGEKTFAQLNDEALFWQYNADSNSIAIIVQHIAGNMLSRWTDFLTSDGEKGWRNRDTEFETIITTRQQMLDRWEQGWECMLNSLTALTEDDLDKTVYIRSEPHSVIDAINRSMAHYPYHMGQIVFIAKMIAGEKWDSLSIPKGQSESFNAQKFNK
jgi:hypothetical protein